ncbi:hypothetical protein [Peribacillus butanolivorans]
MEKGWHGLEIGDLNKGKMKTEAKNHFYRFANGAKRAEPLTAALF